MLSRSLLAGSRVCQAHSFLKTNFFEMHLGDFPGTRIRDEKFPSSPRTLPTPPLNTLEHFSGAHISVLVAGENQVSRSADTVTIGSAMIAVA
jgi:hypothetical protein